MELTAKGKDLVNQLDQPLADLHHALLGHLSTSELKELTRLLEKARASLDTEQPVTP